MKPKPTVKRVVKRETEPKRKEKLSSDDCIIDNEEEEEPDEAELTRRKAREEEMNEQQRIIREAIAKEKGEKEAQLTLKSRKLLFPTRT